MTPMPPWALIIIGLLAVLLAMVVALSPSGAAGMAAWVIGLAGVIAVVAGLERGWKERGRQ